MRLWMVRGVCLSLAGIMLYAGVTHAGGPGPTTVKKSGSKVTVTTTVLTAPLFLGDEENITPAGTIVYTTVTVSTATWLGTSTKTSTTFTVYAYGLDAPDGTVVSFEPFEDSGQLFGSATVRRGKVVVSLSSCRGDTIPVFAPGDDIEIEEGLATGVFGSPCVSQTTSGG